jgi:hypothetical protein
MVGKDRDGYRVASDMSQQGSATPSLTRTESDRRKAILGLLKEALAARRISSVLVGRRTLVLRSAQGQERSDRWEELVRPADPQLYVFAAECSDVHKVTTDGDVYWFAGGSGVPVEDPSNAARAYSWWARCPAD